MDKNLEKLDTLWQILEIAVKNRDTFESTKHLKRIIKLEENKVVSINEQGIASN
jgi:hypothetical protein